MATLAELLRQGADKLINLPSEAQRFVTNPQAFTQLLTGKNPLPRETGFAAGATGLPPTEMSVLDPNQAAYMQGYSQGEPIGYAGMAAPFAAPAAVATGKALAPKLGQVTENYMVRQGMIQPLTAYHGTPHTIQGQFDINKVGTGEGAQAYGHDMYFAQNPKVAEGYQQTLGKSELSVGGKDLEGSQKFVADRLRNSNYEDTLNWINSNKKSFGKEKTAEYRNALESLKETSIEARTGNLYKVDIPDADIPMMLDYDKPIKDQPEILKKVRNLIKDPDILQTFDKNVESGITGANVYANYIPTGVSKFDLLKQRDDLLNKYMTKDMGMSDAVRAMNADDRIAFSQIAQKIDDLKNKPKIVSQVLNEAGITGIRYLDEGSRNATMPNLAKYEDKVALLQAKVKSNPTDSNKSMLDDAMQELESMKRQGKEITSNFVVFDPSTVKILEKNDQPVTRKELIQQQIDKIE